MVYDPDSRHANNSHPIVNFNEDKGGQKIAHEWYQTQADRQGRYVTTDDMNFDGQPDPRTVWKGGEPKQMFIWYRGQWHQVKKHKIKIEGAWTPFKHANFEKGQWHVQTR